MEIATGCAKGFVRMINAATGDVEQQFDGGQSIYSRVNCVTSSMPRKTPLALNLKAARALRAT